MTFNEAELENISKATSEIFKRSPRRAVAQALKAITPSIEAARALPDDEREVACGEFTALCRFLISGYRPAQRKLHDG